MKSENGNVVCYLLFVFAVLCLVRGQGIMNEELLNKLACVEHEVCGACVTAAPHCRWCADPYLGRDFVRCNDYNSLVEAGCGEALIQKANESVWEVLDDRPLQDLEADDLDAGVQLQPQKVLLTLKPRETRKVKFSYRPARNYPLDLYYLMDLTWSMRDDKETLVSLQDDLPNWLRNLTDNFRLGFGSFAEKPLMPYVFMDEKRRANPCSLDGECQPTYSYRHHLPLTNQVQDFIRHVNDSRVTANVDNAEAQLDALVQALTCGDRIGWRTRSRKIIILLSDGLMHFAGDGKLGGVVLRNDEQCHLDSDGYYSEAAVYDYPSIAQLYRLLARYEVNVIFAVTENVKPHYDHLHLVLKDFTYIAKLESNSSNILKLVKTGYEDIISTVDFRDDSTEGPVRVKYFSDCGVDGGPMVETAKCSGVEFGKTLNFEAHLTLDACKEYKMANQTITIYESKLRSESLRVETLLQCGCGCEGGAPDSAAAAAACPAHAHPVCGQCHCDEGWSGPSCNCSITDEVASAALIAQCRQPNSTYTLPCSAKGDCLCGECHCDRGYEGKYCQCKECQLDRDQQACGGPSRGVCACGRCLCALGWSGAACDCPADTARCAAAPGRRPCEGRGDCRCGKCECNVVDGVKYAGAYCETCADCDNPLCADAEPKVECYVTQNMTEACAGAGNYSVDMRLNEPADRDASTCILRIGEDAVECEYIYTYTRSVQPGSILDIVIRKKECYQPTSAKIMASGLIIMVCVVAAGLIVILGIKSAQIVSDRRAYAKFAAEAERSLLGMNERQENPLYISPITEFKLPDSFPREKND